MIEISRLGKQFGSVRALDDVSWQAAPGRVTGLLGPNGSGKTTTLRILMGLVRATSGSATFGGRPYVELPDRARKVGAALESSGFHPGRSGANHLRWLASATGIPDSRVPEVLGLVGLADVAGRRVGGYSLGMRQRLALAAALLGDPQVLILDEPANGLDPEGIAWLRGFLRHLGAQGRTVLVSSHALAEVQQTVDDVVIINAGRLVTAGALGDLLGAKGQVVVETPNPTELAAALAARGAGVTAGPPGVGGSATLKVIGLDRVAVGTVAATVGAVIYGLAEERPALETMFLNLTAGSAPPGGAEPAIAADPGAGNAIGGAR